MSAVAGLRGSGDWATDERPKNFREYILWRNPNGNAPIFALMGRVKKESTNDAEFSWWDEPNDLIRLQVNKAGDYGATETTLVVDSSDPDATAAGKSRAWGVATHLKPGDLLMVEPTSDAATFTPEVVRVESVLSETQFTCTRGASGTTAAAIADNAYLLLIGSAYAEGTDAPSATTRNPIKYYNHTQIFKTTYEITGTAEQTYTRTGDPVANDKKRKMFDHSRAIEQAIMFGQRSETTGSNGKPLRTMGGLRYFIGNQSVFAATPTITTILDAVSPVFDWDSSAGDQRIAFVGNSALNVMNKVLKNDSSTEISYNGTINQFGMKLMSFRFPQGDIFLKTHPLMSRHSLYKNSMFILDFSAIKWRPFKNRDTKFKDNIQTDGEDVRRGLWQTEAGFEVAYGGLTCGYVGNFGA